MHPVLFEYGPVVVRFYGLMYVLAIIIGGYLLKIEVRRKRLPLTGDEVSAFLICVVVSGVIGARLYYVLFMYDYFMLYPIEIPAIWHGGLAIHGGIVGGIVGGFIFLKKRSIPFWRASDACAPVLIMGQSLGRIGNFLNGDAHGVVTEGPFGIVFPAGSPAGDEFPGLPLHPAMLYEFVINLSIFFFLWFVVRKFDHKDGFAFALYLVLYSTGRFFVETVRADSLMLGPLKVAQVVSIALVSAGLIAIFGKRLWARPDSEQYVEGAA